MLSAADGEDSNMDEDEPPQMHADFPQVPDWDAEMHLAIEEGSRPAESGSLITPAPAHSRNINAQPTVFAPVPVVATKPRRPFTGPRMAQDNSRKVSGSKFVTLLH